MRLFSSIRPLTVAVLAAIGASVCCVGPLLLLSLGIGGAWISNLLVFEPYRPLMIGITLVSFALAFQRLYLRQPACAPDEVCINPAVRKRQRAIFWVVASLTIGLLAVPSVAPLFM